MKRRRWKGKTRTGIVIERVQGNPLAELCHTYQSGQSLSDQWRDEFRANASRAFEVHQYTQEEACEVQENAR